MSGTWAVWCFACQYFLPVRNTVHCLGWVLVGFSLSASSTACVWAGARSLRSMGTKRLCRPGYFLWWNFPWKYSIAGLVFLGGGRTYNTSIGTKRLSRCGCLLYSGLSCLCFWATPVFFHKAGESQDQRKKEHFFWQLTVSRPPDPSTCLVLSLPGIGGDYLWIQEKNGFTWTAFYC